MAHLRMIPAHICRRQELAKAGGRTGRVLSAPASRTHMCAASKREQRAVEHRIVFYETASGRPPAQDYDCWILIDAGDGTLEVEHRWTRPRADGLMVSGEGARRLSLPSFFRAEGSDTAKRQLRRLLAVQAAGEGKAGCASG
jgi:hypothetical protein